MWGCSYVSVVSRIQTTISCGQPCFARLQQHQFWAQTLKSIVAVQSSLMDACEGDVSFALVKGLTYPVLVELACEALGSSGRAPERLILSV